MDYFADIYSSAAEGFAVYFAVAGATAVILGAVAVIRGLSGTDTQNQDQ